MRWPHLRPWHGIYLRKRDRPIALVRLPLRQDHSPAYDRARADEEAPDRRKNRSPPSLHFEEGSPVLCLPRAGRRWQGGFRVRAEGGGEGAGKDEDRSTRPQGGLVNGQTSMLRAPSALLSMKL